VSDSQSDGFLRGRTIWAEWHPSAFTDDFDGWRLPQLARKAHAEVKTYGYLAAVR